MTNPRMPVPRMTDEEMREIVLDRLACKVMFSGEIHASSRSLCFLPIALGGMAPPPELVAALVGSSDPPEALESEPPKPTHPGYPEAVGDPPERPALCRTPTEAATKLKWGDIDDGEYQACVEVLRLKNEARIRAWHDKGGFASEGFSGADQFSCAWVDGVVVHFCNYNCLCHGFTSKDVGFISKQVCDLSRSGATLVAFTGWFGCR